MAFLLLHFLALILRSTAGFRRLVYRISQRRKQRKGRKIRCPDKPARSCRNS